MAAKLSFHVESLPIEDVFVIGERRPVNDEAVNVLVQSIQSIGLQTPITVRIYKGDILDPESGEILSGGYAVVTGRHRLEAYRRLGHKDIPAVIRDCDEVEAELWEIAENLHRVDLTKEQRDQHIRRYAELMKVREEKEIPVVQNEPLEFGYGKPPPRPKGMARKISEQTGLSKSTVQRALNPKPRETVITKDDDPDMRVVAHRLANQAHGRRA